MKKKLLLSIVLLINLNIYSQQRIISDVNGIKLSQGYTLNLLNGLGNSSLINHVSNMSELNPAALINFKKFTLGLSYHFEKELKTASVADIGWKRVSTAFPQGFGLVIPLSKFSLGLSFGQKYNSSTIVDPVPIVTVENPDGTGQSYTPKFETIIFNHSFSVSYLFYNFLDNCEFSFGFKYTLGRMNVIDKLFMLGIEEDVFSSGWSIGFNFIKNMNDKKYLQVGLFYDSGNDFEKRVSYEGSGLFVNADDNIERPGQIFYRIEKAHANLFGKVPSSIKLDTDISSIKDIKLLGSISYIFWKDVSENFKNQIEFSGSFVHSLSENLTYSLGFLFTDRRNEELDDFFRICNELQAIFLTAGLLIKSDILNIDLSFADSQLLSEKWRQHTMGKIGVSFNFFD